MRCGVLSWKVSISICVGICISIFIKEFDHTNDCTVEQHLYSNNMTLANVTQNNESTHMVSDNTSVIGGDVATNTNSANIVNINDALSNIKSNLNDDRLNNSTDNSVTKLYNGNILISFRIHNNLYSDARKYKVPQKVISKIINLYKHQLNFKSDLKTGNIVKLIYDGNDNQLIFTSISNSKKTYSVYRYSKHGSDLGYYNDKGICLNQDIFLTPVKNARISSRFGMRVHPVKKVRKIHKGTDFAANIGTPIMAANSGRVIHVGRRGGYGKCIILRHTNGYKTLYGHMSRYADGMTANKSVAKGDIIGYVGKSGLATGPHLHFEIMKNNVKINPEKANFISIADLTAKEKIKFNAYKNQIQSQLETYSASY